MNRRLSRDANAREEISCIMTEDSTEQEIDFNELASACQLVSDFADTFPNDREEYRVLRGAVRVLSIHAIEVQRKAFSAFKKERNLEVDTQKRIGEWLEQNPTRDVGSLVTVSGEAYVLCESLQKGRFLSKVSYDQ